MFAQCRYCSSACLCVSVCSVGEGVEGWKGGGGGAKRVLTA